MEPRRIFKFVTSLLRGHSYNTWSASGVHEMTMIDHEGEGTKNDHVVTWTDQKKVV